VTSSPGTAAADALAQRSCRDAELARLGTGGGRSSPGATTSGERRRRLTGSLRATGVNDPDALGLPPPIARKAAAWSVFTANHGGAYGFGRG
jgi:hypothetical protein